MIEVPLAASAGPGGQLPAGAPAEAWAHLALYRARPDAAAIARAQPPGAFAVAAAVTMMVPLHGQAAWLGESVPVHDDAALLRSPDQAERAARCLPAGEALLLRGNGALTLGATPGSRWPGCGCSPPPATSTWRPWPRPGASPVTPLSAAEIASWRAVGGELLPRLWQHLRHGAGAGNSGAPGPGEEQG